MDWFAGLMGLIGVIVGAGIQEFRIWRARKDKYKEMIFGRRLEVHQEAYYRLKGLLESMFPPRLMKEGGRKALAEGIREYRKWQDKNALYLDGDSRKKIVVFLEYARETGSKYKDREWVKKIDVKDETEKLLKNMTGVLDSVQRGIGVDYLPKEEVSLEEGFLEKMFDEVVEKTEGLVRKQEES